MFQLPSELDNVPMTYENLKEYLPGLTLRPQWMVLTILHLNCVSFMKFTEEFGKVRTTRKVVIKQDPFCVEVKVSHINTACRFHWLKLNQFFKRDL